MDERESILIVDDDESTRDTLKLILEKHGYETGTAGRGHEAVGVAQGKFFNLALLDIRLPDMEGGELIAPLKEMHPDMAVIMITAYASLDTAVRALNEGASAYIAKPLNMDEVLATVREVLEKQRLVRENRRLYQAAQRELAERMRAEKEIQDLLAQTQEQAEQVQQIIDTVPEGVLLLDGEQHILLTNPMAREHLSVLTDAGAGDTLTHLGGWPIEELLDLSHEALRREVVVEGLPRQVFEVVTQRMGSESGGWVLVSRDVTEERLAQQRIHQQERLAAVGQLAAGIAHDFNNLLTGIIGFAQLLQMRVDIPKSAHTDLQRILEQAQRAAHLVRQVLDFSRRSTIERRPLDLVPFVKEAARFLERTIPENINVVLEMTPGEYLVNADPIQIQQLLTNLALNARDAMPEGGELRFRLSRFTLKPAEAAPFPGMGPGEWIALSVSDTGVGMSPEVLSHIFEPFFTTKEPGAGTGLGLAQVYGIVKQHEGFIDVGSRVGEGTTFVIYLPPLPLRDAERQEAVDETPPGHGETVLLVEDEPEVLEAGRAMLEHLGYRVLTAINGEEALKVHAEHKDEIALVLSDLVMPRTGGMQLYRLLREQDPAVKMVVVTGYPLGEEIKNLLAQGIAGWVQKPILLEELAQVVHRALKGERRH